MPQSVAPLEQVRSEAVRLVEGQYVRNPLNVVGEDGIHGCALGNEPLIGRRAKTAGHLRKHDASQRQKSQEHQAKSEIESPEEGARHSSYEACGDRGHKHAYVELVKAVYV